MSSIKRGTTKKKSAKKGAPKKKKGAPKKKKGAPKKKKGAPKKKKGASKKRSAMSAVEPRPLQGALASAPMSAVELRGLQGVLASREFRADTSWPRKEEVKGWDSTAFDVPGNFEAFCIKYRIWPWDRGPHARPIQCVRCEPKNEPVYYKDAEGNTRVAQRRNDYHLAQECL
jgi:hypothetical protein